MVDRSVISSSKKYLKALHKAGVPVDFGMLFGSHARGTADKWSDIDLAIISGQYDGVRRRADINQAWRVAARTDNRIEPVLIGKQQFAEDDSSPIVEIVRREGVKIQLTTTE
jgi:predicted nucleotidyltransferase